MDFRSKRRRHSLLALLLSISATTCSAPKDDTADATADPSNVVAESANSLDFADELANLVGLKHRSGFLEGGRIIGGWTIEDYNGADYGIQELEYLGHTVLLLDSLTHRESRKAYFQIVAVLSIPPLADREIVVPQACHLNDEGDKNLVAIVEHEDERWYTNVKRVWRANPNPASFDEIPTTGVKCRNEYYGLDHLSSAESIN